MKSIRCELVTYIAANNQRNILFAAEAKTRGLESAVEKYQYYEIDPTRFGAATLTLQIQDSAGLGAGTQADLLVTQDAGIHTRFLDIGPTVSDQSTYAASWNFIIPQDAITLHASHSGERAGGYSCFSEIPKRYPTPFGSIYVEDDMEAVAKNDYPQYALFKRIWVNNEIPLAAWLGDVGNSMTQATLNWHDVSQKPDRIIPAQMMYTFSVQVTGGIDVRFGLTAPMWPLVGAEVSGAIQKINTIVIILNGVEAYDWYLAQDGGAINKEARPLPTIKVNGAAGPLPSYIGRRQPRGYPEWPGILVPRIPPTH